MKERFNEIKRQFFPSWDREGLWKYRSWSARGSRARGYCGYCDHETNTIEVLPAKDPDEYDLALIHEMAHAVTRDAGHGAKWRKRMEKAAEQADTIRRRPLAKKLRQEVSDYEKAKKAEKVSWYDEARDLMIDANRPLSWKQLVANLADRHCLKPGDIKGKSRKEIRRGYQEVKEWHLYD
jgi:hypothetical protein